MITLARRVGASPAHLVLLVACLALAAYAAFFLLGDPGLLRVLVWFAGAALVHDLVLFPLYSVLDRVLVAAGRGRVPLVNHVRVPALGAGLALLMFWPGIVRQGEDTHLAATGLDQSPYLARWLGLTAVLFGLSALVYGGRVVVGRPWRRRSTGSATRGPATTGPPTTAPPSGPGTAGPGPAGATTAAPTDSGTGSAATGSTEPAPHEPVAHEPAAEE